MSGGSFDYAFMKLPERLGQAARTIVEMRNAVDQGGERGSHRVCARLSAIKKAIDVAQHLIEMENDLLHDIEWWASCDYSWDQVIE